MTIRSGKASEIILIVLNVFGLAAFLCFSSLIWAPRGDEGLYGGPGDPIIWVIGALPWLAICSFFNLLALRTFFARAIIYRRWRPLLLLIVLISLWICAFEYDSSRHYDGHLLR